MFLYFKKALNIIWPIGKFWILITVLFSIVNGLIPVLSIWITKELINSVLSLIEGESSSKSYSFTFLLLQFSLIVISSVLKNVQIYIDRKFQVKLDHVLQIKIFKKTTSVPFYYFDLPEFYNHLDRISGSQGVRFISPINSIFKILQETIVLSSIMIYLWSIHWSLVLLSLLAAIPYFIFNYKFGNQMFMFHLNQTPLAREVNYTSYLLQDRQNAKEIRLFNLGGHLIKHWSSKYLVNENLNLKLMRKRQFLNVSLDALTTLFYSSSAGIIIWLITKTQVKIGDFVAIGQAVQASQSAINNISESLASITEENLYLEDYFKFTEFNNIDNDQDYSKLNFPNPLKQGIQVKNFHFKYANNDNYILKDISFTISAGEKIAIVGENGSGKTTLVKCLMGLYPATKGTISFDNHCINDIKETDLRKYITVIFQDFMRYEFSVRDNIVFGDITNINNEDKMKEASINSGASKFIELLPKSYETYLGRFLYDGEDLSGGQWQKIALARALFKEGEIIILDEPTASLDPKAEIEVYKQFELLSKNKTAIYISHRMAAAKLADKIIVMKDGSIIEQGTHDELLKLEKEYFRMYKIQSEWFNK
ncbi:ABC transporter ATP-binding protein [Brevibacillus daliensis]|uniref:ABC transporter ATP-binding protein n=1 Tax=Brevibacillus daliensis TaxID=2892995 RepID=UPI001E4893DE|nr:ABC transporter ATP-binding protein [Brevibacillus daliensis]